MTDTRRSDARERGHGRGRRAGAIFTRRRRGAPARGAKGACAPRAMIARMGARGVFLARVRRSAAVRSPAIAAQVAWAISALNLAETRRIIDVRTRRAPRRACGPVRATCRARACVRQGAPLSPQRRQQRAVAGCDPHGRGKAVARAIDRLHARGSRPAAPCATAVPSLGRERPPRRGQGVDARLFSARARRHETRALRVFERGRSAAWRAGASRFGARALGGIPRGRSVVWRLGAPPSPLGQRALWPLPERGDLRQPTLSVRRGALVRVRGR